MKRVQMLVDQHGLTTGEAPAGSIKTLPDGWAEDLIGRGLAVELPSLPYAVGDLVIVRGDQERKRRRVESVLGTLVQVSWEPRWPSTQRLHGLFPPASLVLVCEASDYSV